jgi:hemerythrin
MIQWNDSFLTGNPKVDADHQRLFAYVNELEKALKDGVSFEKLTSIVEFMGRYAKAHFISEEAIMLRAKCPAHEENRSAHEAFNSRVRDWFYRLNEGGSNELVIEIYQETSKWLVEHIVKVDCQLRGCHIP